VGSQHSGTLHYLKWARTVWCGCQTGRSQVSEYHSFLVWPEAGNPVLLDVDHHAVTTITTCASPSRSGGRRGNGAQLGSPRGERAATYNSGVVLRRKLHVMQQNMYEMTIITRLERYRYLGNGPNDLCIQSESLTATSVTRYPPSPEGVQTLKFQSRRSFTVVIWVTKG
jgi:hypothetical protein